MSKPRDRMIYRRPEGTWADERNDADRASGVHDTQREAIEAARRMLRNQGGGELSVRGGNGQIRSKDAISPGNDPCQPRDASIEEGWGRDAPSLLF